MTQNASSSHKKLLESCEEGDNMVSNLPLLFAAGYPTSLDKITEQQLEIFIPFMVQCSLGDIRLPLIDRGNEPEWWPEDIPFVIPFQKPKHFNGDWTGKMKEIVAICYNFHKSVFLLRFCENLSKYQPESLRFIDNYNSTTSLYDRSSNKLLVTFRNENRLYDQRTSKAKQISLMPKKSNTPETQQMVEPSLFEIYLCDNCDAELYSHEAAVEHEKTCRPTNGAYEADDDDDVIFCGEEEIEPEDIAQKQLNFLHNLQLFNPLSEQQPLTNRQNSPQKRNLNSNNNNNTISVVNDKNKTDQLAVPDKKARAPRKKHAATIFAKCPIPIVSSSGQKIIEMNSQMVPGYQRERIDRYERLCPAPAIAFDGSNRPKFMDKKFHTYTNPSFRSNTKHFHYYKFPRRQLSTKNHDAAVAQLNAIRFRETSCKPLTITLNRLTDEQIERLRTMKKRKLSSSSSLNPAKRLSRIVDYIDLCSEDENSNQYDGSEDSNETASTSSDQHSNPERNALLFVDCSKPSPSSEFTSNSSASLDTLGDTRFQSTTVVRTQCNSTTNKMQEILAKRVQPVILFKDDRIQNDKENHLYPYIADQTSSSTQNRNYLYESEMDNALDVPNAIPANKFISIDLTI